MVGQRQGIFIPNSNYYQGLFVLHCCAVTATQSPVADINDPEWRNGQGSRLCDVKSYALSPVHTVLRECVYVVIVLKDLELDVYKMVIFTESLYT